MRALNALRLCLQGKIKCSLDFVGYTGYAAVMRGRGGAALSSSQAPAQAVLAAVGPCGLRVGEIELEKGSIHAPSSCVTRHHSPTSAQTHCHRPCTRASVKSCSTSHCRPTHSARQSASHRPSGR
jgi:hypothetical protein